MSAVADGAESIEGGDAERRGEISVGATAHGALAQVEIHLLRERFGAGEEGCAHFAFERRAVKTAGDLQAGSPVKWTQGVQTAFHAAHVGNPHGTKIKNSARVFRNYVRARAAFDDAGVDGDAAAKIIPSFDPCELPRQFVDGVDTFLRCETRVRGAAMHDQFGFADSLAGRFQQAARAEGRLDDENGITAARFRFEEFARGFAADLLVRSPDKDEAFAKRYFRLLKRLQREKCLNDSGLHVKSPWAVSFSAFQAERHFGECSRGVDRIVMAQDQELARRARFVEGLGDAKKISTMLLRESFHARAVPIPFFGDDATATVDGGFLQAG